MQPFDTDFQPPHARDFLAKEGLKKIKKTVQELIKIEKIMLEMLPRELVPYCKVQCLENDKLILTADSAVWATRLRLISANLLNSLQSFFPAIKKIHIAVRPVQQKKSKPAKKIQRVSTENAKIVSYAAKFVKNEKLKDSLVKLSKTLSRLG